MTRKIRDISVIVPALNAQETINGCLGAILSQEVDRAFDVTVAVGPCVDNTAEIVSKLAKS